MKKLTLIIVTGTFILMSASNSFSQSNSTADAFSKSYQSETKSDFKGAIETLKQVYDKSSYETNLRMGWLYYKAGSYKESQTYYQLAIDLKPSAIEAKFGYVYPAYALGNMNEVVAQYNKILTIDPQNTTANYRMGMISYDKKDYQVAYKYFEKVVSLYPFSYDALIMYAWSSYRVGKKEDAKILFDRVLCLSPGDKSALEGLSYVKK
jgi:tetratricopeptide (TPR) repeat protein